MHRLFHTAAIGLASVPFAAIADQYTCSVTGASTFSGNITASVNITATVKGNYVQVTNETGTRTITGLFGGSTAAPRNDTISPLTGTGGGNGTASTVPTGSMLLRFNAFSRTLEVFNASIDLNGASTDPSIPVSMNITYPSFRTINPTYTYIWLGIPIPIPLGSATLLSNTLTQNGRATTTCTAGPGNSYTFTMDIPVTADAVVNTSAGDTPVSLPLTLSATGTFTPGASSATAQMQFAINQSQPITPVAGDPLNPLPFALPAPSTANPPPPPANVLMVVSVTGGSVSVTGNTTIPTSGNRSSLADVGKQGGLLGPDGLFTSDDFVVFIDKFFASDPLADVGAQGGVATPDGLWDNNDFVVFINAFFGE